MTQAKPALPGRLSSDRFGYSMPVDCPYYPEPPYLFRRARGLIISYPTDPQAAAALLPEGLTLPAPATAIMLFVDYPESTFGSYSEAVQGIVAVWEGEPYLYTPHIYVDSATSLVGGREIWGFPKKMAAIELQSDRALIAASLERPAGLRLATATMCPDGPPDPQPPPLAGNLSLRVIPDPAGGDKPSLAQLIRSPTENVKVHSAAGGTATLSFDTESSSDPLHRLPMTAPPARGVYQIWDFTIPAGEVLRTY